MQSHEQLILRILGEAPEPLFPSEITDRLNRELGGRCTYRMTEVVVHLASLSRDVSQVRDGRWTLKRRVA